MTATKVYEASHVKRRRRTNAELAAVDEAIMAVLEEEHPATLRGTYYRAVSAGAVDKTEAGYQLVGRQVLKLRRSGRLPYSWITDGTRYVIRPSVWRTPEAMVAIYASSYRKALWADQGAEVQIFVEKDAISGVIEPVTYGEWQVPLGVLRGYASESFCWTVAESVQWKDWPVYFYQLGDHDPSGIDAWRDFEDKVRRFAPESDLRFERIAVTPDQIVELNLPTRPTKTTDSRARNFKGESVEVDAIKPSTLREIVENAITQHIDHHQLAVHRIAEESEREWLRSMSVGGDR